MADKDVSLSIGVDDSALVTGLKSAESAVKASVDVMSGNIGGIGTAFAKVQGLLAAFTAALAGGAVFKAGVEESQRMTGEANKLARALGISTTEASELNVALGDIYSSADDFTAASSKLAKQLRTNEEALNSMGLKTRDANGEYLPLNPRRADTKPGSFTINRDTGAWADFASGDRGGDLVALVAYVQDIKQGEAAKRLGAFLGLDISATSGKASNRPASAPAGQNTGAAAAQRTSSDGKACVMPVPDDAPAPPAGHSRYGRPAKRWAYRSAAGAVLFFHDRYEPPGQRKQFSPLTLWRDEAGRLAWQFKAPPEPRSPLGLDELATRPTAPVLLVEGEKARDAAATLAPEHVAMTWAGGVQAIGKVDFSALAGRDCLLWPDADAPGIECMGKLAGRLQAGGAASVRVLNPDALALSIVPGDVAALASGEPLQAGDDAADLVGRGWSAQHFALILADSGAWRVPSAPARPPQEEKPAQRPAAVERDTPTPKRFELNDKGVWLNESDRSPRWLCARLEVAAMVRDPHNQGWGLLVEFADPDQQLHRLIVPLALFGGEPARVACLLLDRGLKIAPKAVPLLVEYLQTFRTMARARVTGRTGWHDTTEGAVFVLPAEAIGPNGNEWIFETDAPTSAGFSMRGTLAEWRREVAALCAGNSRLVFSVASAFAAPLLYLLGGDDAEGGGFHLRSNSSDGKTTALRVAASVCGGPGYMQRWRATDNGLEGLAQQHCDALLILDEIAQIDPKAAGDVAYMLANGGGKARAAQSGGARRRTSWRVLFLSAGEIGLTEHMGEVGKSPRAGQELRLAEIPADAGAGLGVFEELHGRANGNEFAKALAEAVRRSYGTPWIAFLQELAKRQAEVPDLVRQAIRSFESHCLNDEAHGQARRVATRFALVGAAGELATQWGITGWQQGEAMKAARACFQAWLSRRGGQGNQEEKAILRQVLEYLQRYEESRFTDWERPAGDTDKHAPAKMDRAGFRRRDSATDETEFFIFTETFRAQVCKGFDPAAVGRLLLKYGYIEEGKERDRPWLKKEQLPTMGRMRVVHVLPKIWEADHA